MTCFHLHVLALQVIAHPKPMQYKAYVISAGWTDRSSYRGVAAMSAAFRLKEVAMPSGEAS